MYYYRAPCRLLKEITLLLNYVTSELKLNSSIGLCYKSLGVHSSLVACFLSLPSHNIWLYIHPIKPFFQYFCFMYIEIFHFSSHTCISAENNPHLFNFSSCSSATLTIQGRKRKPLIIIRCHLFQRKNWLAILSFPAIYSLWSFNTWTKYSALYKSENIVVKVWPTIQFLSNEI